MAENAADQILGELRQIRRGIWFLVAWMVLMMGGLGWIYLSTEKNLRQGLSEQDEIIQRLRDDLRRERDLVR